MTTQLTQTTRTMRFLVADPRANELVISERDRVAVEVCSTGRAALRHADEPLDYVLLSTSLFDMCFQDVAEMYASTNDGVGLIVVSENPNVAEEALTRRLGAILYRAWTPDLDWLGQLRPRHAINRMQAPAWTLDWQQRPSRRTRPRHTVGAGQ